MKYLKLSLETIAFVFCCAFTDLFSAEYVFATKEVDEIVKSDVRKRVRLCLRANGASLQSIKISKSSNELFLIWTFNCDNEMDFTNIVNFIINNVNIPVARLDTNKISDSVVAEKNK